MGEQTANLCTTDACESLRARLAKYEDAEGRPVVVEQTNLVKDLRFAVDHEPWDCAELFGKAADALELKSSEASRLKQMSDNYCALLMDANQELAALKAQPSGVVLPEPMKRGDEGGSGEYGAAMIRGYNACLRKVARLNSSPVTDGGVDERAAHWFSLVMGCAMELEQAAISIGDDDEAKRIANSGAKHYMKKANEAWQARAAMHRKDDMP